MVTATAHASLDTAEVTGQFLVHSCPRALMPHVEWALAREIGRVVKLTWTTQPLLPGMMRTEVEWTGPAGTAAAVASSLLGWQQLRFEITEDAHAADIGGRWMHTPTLGIHHTPIDAAGNAMLSEQVIRHAIEATALQPEQLGAVLQARLGSAWDRELEPFRLAEEGDATIFTLHRVS